jgi:hypothetical protein
MVDCVIKKIRFHSHVSGKLKFEDCLMRRAIAAVCLDVATKEGSMTTHFIVFVE